MTKQVGTVAELWRYPVKAMRGERVRELSLRGRGPVGDRLYALRELKHGAIMSARLFPAMLRLRARCNSEASVAIELPDGRVLAAEHPDSNRILSELFGFAVRLDRPGSGHLSPDDVEKIRAGRAFYSPRDFYDEDVVHVLASGTLDYLRGLGEGASDFDPRRFRPTIYLDTGSETPGFLEDQWLGGALRIADAKLVFVRPAMRCVVTTHPQEELPPDRRILDLAVAAHGGYVGVFTSVGRPGTIRAGDPVMLDDQDGGRIEHGED